jgi:hypothetical protein
MCGTKGRGEIELHRFEGGLTTYSLGRIYFPGQPEDQVLQFVGWKMQISGDLVLRNPITPEFRENLLLEDRLFAREAVGL